MTKKSAPKKTKKDQDDWKTVISRLGKGSLQALLGHALQCVLADPDGDYSDGEQELLEDSAAAIAADWLNRAYKLSLTRNDVVNCMRNVLPPTDGWEISEGLVAMAEARLREPEWATHARNNGWTPPEADDE